MRASRTAVSWASLSCQVPKPTAARGDVSDVFKSG